MRSEALTEYVPWDALSEAEQSDEVDRVYRQADPATAEGILRAAWPGDYDKNVAFAQAMMGAVPGTLDVLRMLEAVGLGDSPAVLKWLASAGRLMAGVPGDPRSIPTTIQSKAGAIAMSEDFSAAEGDAFDEAADNLMDEQARAQATGNLAKVKRLDREIRALFVRRYGTDPAVGSSGGATA